MSISLALNNALSGLRVNQETLAVISHNIANANTTGYSRQTANYESIMVAGRGSGVTIGDISRKIDTYLVKSAMEQQSVLGQADVLGEYSARIQTFLGAPGSSANITSFVTSYFNALETLTLQPSNSTQQSAVLGSATSLARETASLSNELQELRFQADQDINEAITKVNSLLGDLHDLNITLASATLSGKPTTGLQDSRDKLIGELAQYININTYEKENGQTNINTSNGIPLVDESRHELRYPPAGSAATFAGDSNLGALTVVTIGIDGEVTTEPYTLASGGASSQVTSILTGGKLAGLLQMRDGEIPDMLDQLDLWVATIRDQVNAVHNTGTGFPGVNSFTSTQVTSPFEYTEWTGSVRFAVLDANGDPVPSVYPGQTATPPLTLDLSTLDTGLGEGRPTLQGLMDAINEYYTPRNKVELGNLNNIELVSRTDGLPSGDGLFNFDIALQNLSSVPANFYVTGVAILDSDNNPMAAPTSTQTTFAIASYDTAPSSNVVRVNVTGSTSGLAEGQIIYLGDPGTAVDGISASGLTGYFTITNLTGTSFDIEAASNAQTGLTQAAVGTPQAVPAYQPTAANSSGRTDGDAIFSADLSGNTLSPYYTIRLNVGVDDGSGTVKTSTVTYRVANNVNHMRNDYFGAIAADGNATLVEPSTVTPQLRAVLVNENGVELPTFGGVYSGTPPGYLRIKATDSNQYVVIDSMDSRETGKPNVNPAVPATDRSFAHYYNLNNFFVAPDAEGDPIRNAAQNLAVEQRLLDVPSRLAMGVLTPSVSIGYAYERNVGDNTTVSRLSGLANAKIIFAATGGLGVTSRTLGDYGGQIISAVSSRAAGAKINAENANALITEFVQRIASVSGVNLDEELANTIIYQNSYSASARVITVAKDLFDILLQSFG